METAVVQTPWDRVMELQARSAQVWAGLVLMRHLLVELRDQGGPVVGPRPVWGGDLEALACFAETVKDLAAAVTSELDPFAIFQSPPSREEGVT